MDAILRVSDFKGIVDYDLSRENSPISVMQFVAVPFGGGWSYQASKPFPFGDAPEQGRVCVGDVFFLDEETETKILILPKLPLRRQALDFSGRLTVGRGEDCQLRFSSHMVSISNRHCVFLSDRNGIQVQDLGSSNGTFVNGRAVSQSVAQSLKNGDEIKVGPYTFGVAGGLFLKNADESIRFAGPRTAGPAKDVEAVYAKPTGRPYPWFSRAPRLHSQPPALRVEIESAPAIGEKPGMGMAAIAMSIPAIAISLGMTALHYALGRKKYTDKEKKRAELYARYLTGIEERLKDFAGKQRAYALALHPDTAACIGRVDGPKQSLWERQPDDPDFLSVRLGTGKEPTAAQIVIPMQHLTLQEDEFAKVPEQIRDKYATVDGMPICCDLKNVGVCGVLGSRPQAVELVCAMVAQLAALHSYDEVKLVVVFPQAEREKWEWMRWLPHCRNSERDMRYIACDKSGVKEILPELEAVVQRRIHDSEDWKFGSKSVNLPYYIFIVADQSLLADSSIGHAMMMNRPDLGIGGIILGQSMSEFPHSVRNVIRVAPTPAGLSLSLQRNGENRELVTRELEVPLSVYRVFARKMAPVRLNEYAAAETNDIPNYVSLFDKLHIRDISRLDLSEYWDNARPEVTMSVPLGVGNGGELYYFDIHEKAQGVHGLIAGGTGSGKSMLVQAWIGAMALQFSPEDVNFVLVDFKGESLIEPFRGLPHLAGFTSNVQADVRRKFLAVESEMNRRMVVLRDHGCKDILEYREARRRNPSMLPLPFLILVVDEFADFKAQYPEFTAPIDHLFQAGRALGMFAILMTQKPAGKVTAQMEANLGFSWCLRVKDEGDSREVLGTGDAAHLREAGRAYVKAKDGTYTLIQGLYGGDAYMLPRQSRNKGGAQVFALKLNGRTVEDTAPAAPAKSGLPTELEVLTRAIADYCQRKMIPPAQPIWQEELPKLLELADMERRWDGKHPADPPARPVALLGLYDDPAHQVQDVLTHDFWEEGNLALYGMAKSGKTTFLQTLLISLCDRYSPAQVQMYLLESGGYSIRSLERYPHVGAAAGDDEPEQVGKIVKLLTEEVDRRRKTFRAAGVTTLESYLEAGEGEMATILLAVDHLNRLGKVFPDVMADIVKLAGSGPSTGIYVAATFLGTSDVSYQLVQNIGRFLALRLADKTDYAGITGHIHADPTALPVGRGYVRTGTGPILFHTAMKYTDRPDSKRAVAIRNEANAMRGSWHGAVPAGIRTVLEKLPFGSVEGEAFVLGLDTDEGQPVGVPVRSAQSLMVSFGDPQGAETFYRSFIRQTAAAGGETWMYTASPAGFSDLLDGERLLDEMRRLDALVEPLAVKLRARQAELQKDMDARFPPLLVIVDGMKRLLMEEDETTANRLESFVRLGRDLGFFLVCGDSAANMSYCRYAGSSFLAVTMRARARLICGGSLAEHQLFDNASLRSGHPGPLKADEAVLLEREGGVPVFLKLMRGDRNGTL